MLEAISSESFFVYIILCNSGYVQMGWFPTLSLTLSEPTGSMHLTTSHCKSG